MFWMLGFGVLGFCGLLLFAFAFAFAFALFFCALLLMEKNQVLIAKLEHFTKQAGSIAAQNCDH